MIANSLHRACFVTVLAAAAMIATRADAQCCGTATTAFYQPVTAYSPTVYTSYYGGGWYPGYWLNRVRARLWGSPTTYVAAYPTAAYSVSYAPTQSVSYAPSFAAPAMGCSSCSSYTVGYSSCCSQCTLSTPCTSCATTVAMPVAGQVVTQAVHQQPTGCPSCAVQQTAVAVPAPATVQVPAPVPAATGLVPTPAPTYAAPTPAPTPVPQGTYGTQQNGAPVLDPGAHVPDRSQEAQRPANDATNGTNNGATNGANDTHQHVYPEPGADAEEKDPYKVNSDNSTYFQAPKLFDPNDRTAQRSIAPVTMAIYEKPASYRNASMQRITADQAERDALGWVSGSN